MAQIMVTAAQLRQAASELRDLNSQFKTQVSSLEASESTLRGQWQGEANDAFHNAFTNDKGQMDTFAQVIEQYCAMLEEIAAKYEQAEAQNVSTAQTRTY